MSRISKTFFEKTMRIAANAREKKMSSPMSRFDKSQGRSSYDRKIPQKPPNSFHVE